MQVLLSNALLVDATMAEPRHGHVLVEDGVIRDLDARPAGAEGRTVIDLHGRTLMPGLIDCHVHVVASLMNLSANAQLPDAMAVLRSLPIMRGMLARGFTTVRDVGGAPPALAEAVEQGLAGAPACRLRQGAVQDRRALRLPRARRTPTTPTGGTGPVRRARADRRRGGRGAPRGPAGAAPGRTLRQDHGQRRRRQPDRSGGVASATLPMR